jgi:hypothetical protein
MKTSQNSRIESATTIGAIKNACVASCRKAMAQVARLKEKIFTESRALMAAHETMLRLALNEAESLASQTAYPHLVFPTLATEKVQAVVAWNARQQALSHKETNLALARW